MSRNRLDTKRVKKFKLDIHQNKYEYKMKKTKINEIEALGELDVILYLFEKGVLKRNKNCVGCSIPMDLKKAQRRLDKYEWRCINNNCENRLSNICVRDGTWVSGFRQPLKEILKILYFISLDLPATKIVLLSNICKGTYHRYKKVIHDKIEKHFLDSPILLGGPYTEVQVDETMISFKGKNHRGLNPVNKTWALCITDNSTTPSLGYVEIIPDKKATTLLPIIRRVVRPGTLISTDEFSSYSSLQFDPNYMHSTVCHK